jgi:hypothetical protein
MAGETIMALIKVNNRGQSSDFSTEIGATKNLIINGAMQVAQRGTSGTATGDGFYPSIDRFKWRSYGGAGRASFEQSTDTPNGDFRYSLKATVTTVNSGLDQYDSAISQVIEGYNRLPLGWGTSTASSCTISFWVKTSIAGIYSVSMRVGSGGRSQVQETPSLTANTWTKVTLTFVGDTDGTWLTSNYGTNGTGLILEFNVGRSNAKNTTTFGSWIGSNRVSSDNQVRWIATSGATFYLTGVQVEKGSTATDFEHRSFGEELQLCQRYYSKASQYGSAWDAGEKQKGSFSSHGSSNGWFGPIEFPVTMRTPPTMQQTGTQSYNGSTWGSWSSVSMGARTENSCYADCSGGVSTSNGQSMLFQMYWDANAEL